MPTGPKLPVFLDRAAYRQRRLRDASRLLPVLGAVLWLVPLLWVQGGDATGAGDAGAAAVTRNSSALLYIFGVWGGIIVAAALLAAWIRADDPAPPAPEVPADPAGPPADRHAADRRGPDSRRAATPGARSRRADNRGTV